MRDLALIQPPQSERTALCPRLSPAHRPSDLLGVTSPANQYGWRGWKMFRSHTESTC
ncbi:hypothetical protein PO909_000255 [Leuciscus waleckii]